MPIALAIKKYGVINFKIEKIDIAYNQEELNLLEGVYISWFNTLTKDNFGYNIKNIINGKGKHSEKTKTKIKNKAKEPQRLELICKINMEKRGNSIKGSKSQYCGVSPENNKWAATCSFNKKQKWIGTYLLESDAAKAYDIAVLKYYGNNTKLNFPELREKYLNNEIILNKCKNKKSNSKIIGVCFNKQKNKWVFRRKGIFKSFKSKELAEEFALNYIKR